MHSSQKVSVLYFTDILCIWAYIAQVRIDQLKNKFGTDIDLHTHFVSVFGAVEHKMQSNWGSAGGAPAYGKHVKAVASQFEHIDVHPDIWVKNKPATSGSCHLFLKAIQILEDREELPTPASDRQNKSLVEMMAWELRQSFFKDLIDISAFHSQMQIAEKLGLPQNKIQQLIQNGEAFAALDYDAQLKERYQVVGSPSLILNEGRQIIYGNVGYRVIEANVQELINQPVSQASWC